MTADQYRKLVKKSRNDICWFVETLILAPFNKEVGTNFYITRQQKQGLLALSDLAHAKRKGLKPEILGVSIMSGKGTGKDAFTSWAILWFMFVWRNPKVPCISVSADQLDKVLWSEISKWLMHSEIKPMFVLQTDKLFMKDVEDEDMRGKQWFAFKKAANPKSSPEEQVETLQGIHEDYMLEVVDEGSGIHDKVFETLEKNMTGMCNLMLIIFNPMRKSGYAVETQYSKKHRWHTMIWSAEESEIVDQKVITRALEDCNGDRNANTFRMNILGLPPIFDEETLFDWDWVMDAVDRDFIIPEGTPLVASLDCGAGGDSSIIASRRGYKINPFKKKKTPDSTELSNWAGAEIDIHNPDVFRVDVVGIGWAVEGLLRDKKGGIIEAADSRRKADNPERFVNKRAEMYWNLRDMFEKGVISIPDDANFKTQLGAMRYKLVNGKIQLPEKRAIKNDIGHSPDECDAAAMLFYYPDNMTSKKEVYYDEPEYGGGSWMSA
jgi:hypothetical protein